MLTASNEWDFSPNSKVASGRVHTALDSEIGMLTSLDAGFIELDCRSGQSVTASDFGSNGPRFESGRGRWVESLDKALYSHCPKEKPSH